MVTTNEQGACFPAYNVLRALQIAAATPSEGEEEAPVAVRAQVDALTAKAWDYTEDLDETCCAYAWATYRKVVYLDDAIDALSSTPAAARVEQLEQALRAKIEGTKQVKRENHPEAYETAATLDGRIEALEEVLALLSPEAGVSTNNENK